MAFHGAGYAVGTLTPFYKTHRLTELARAPGAAILDQLCAEAAEHIARVDAWTQDRGKTAGKRRELAKKIGLGRKGRTAATVEAPPPEAPKPRRLAPGSKKETAPTSA